MNKAIKEVAPILGALQIGSAVTALLFLLKPACGEGWLFVSIAVVMIFEGSLLLVWGVVNHSRIRFRERR